MESVHSVRLSVLFAGDEVLSGSGYGLSERRALRKRLRASVGDVVLAAAKEFATRESVAVEDGEDETDDRPILAFWKWLIENERIQKFMKFLVEEFLPALFQIIVALISALAAI